jgi:hypothetical protein
VGPASPLGHHQTLRSAKLLKSTAIVHGVEDPTCFGLDPPMLVGASPPWITAACEVHCGQGRAQRRGRAAVAQT